MPVQALAYQALHVLVNLVHELLGGGEAAPSANERFYDELKKLKAAEWLKGFR